MHIYRITNTVNGKVYIGQDSGNTHHRWYYHRWAHDRPTVADYEKRLYRAMRKYGILAFTYEVLEEVEDRAALAVREDIHIAAHRSTEPEFGYNAKGGGTAFRQLRTRYRVRCPADIEQIVDDLPEFCRTHGLIAKRMYGLAGGKANAKHHRGWQCVKENDEFPSRQHRGSSRKGIRHSKPRCGHSKTAIWEIVSPCGQVIQIENLKLFCQNEGLHYRSMMRVSSGERPHHKGWRINSSRSKYTDSND